MQFITKKSWAALCVATVFATPAVAELSAADVGKLGTTLSPIGADKAANAAGTIPAWDGGITKALPNFKAGQQYPNPFAGDKPSFTITGQNAEQYRANLTDGQ